jgi:hypothetical protein
METFIAAPRNQREMLLSYKARGGGSDLAASSERMQLCTTSQGFDMTRPLGRDVTTVHERIGQPYAVLEIGVGRQALI